MRKTLVLKWFANISKDIIGKKKLKVKVVWLVLNSLVHFNIQSGEESLSLLW